MLPASCVSKREQEWEGLGTEIFQGLILKNSQSLPAEERTIRSRTGPCPDYWARRRPEAGARPRIDS